ncbi:MAG: HAMP domain-containing histidine kinase [Parcubacteria group bacterium]|nr:HAMP domain-containing histidine kinase [Parcubacteria group bacterium]
MNSFLFPTHSGKHFFVLLAGTLTGGILGWILYNFVFGSTDCVEIEQACFSLFSLTLFREILITGGIFFGFAIGLIISLFLSSREVLLSQKEIIRQNIGQNLAKDDLISMVLHHIRTPLTGMMWSVKELATEAPKESPEKIRLDRLYDETIRVLNTIEQLIKTSKANKGQISYSFVDMDTEGLEHLATESISKMRASAYAKDISVEIETLPLSKRTVKVDKDKIITIIQTLFENAVIYTNNGGDIKIRIEEKRDEFLFHISDSGIGIPEIEQEKVFSQFFRCSNARKERPDGVGIGLYLAKTFARSHNGDITFASNSHGTTFTVRLPISMPPKAL